MTSFCPPQNNSEDILSGHNGNKHTERIKELKKTHLHKYTNYVLVYKHSWFNVF